jgi:hypothetical protein
MQRQLSQRLCVDTSQTGGVGRSDRSPRDSGTRPRTQAREGPVDSSVCKVALWSARPPRTPSDVAEMNEEYQMRLDKLGFGDNCKCETNIGKYI